MANSVYQINKGINKSIEFKGLKAQYIWYLAAGIGGLLVLFAAMYIMGINSFICLAVILILGCLLVFKVYGMSNKYGEYGMMKALAKRSIPKVVRLNSRKIFIHKNNNRHGKE
ncbi:MAG: DUF4133 domain-containing protein [Sphingobacteriales bacterium]|nr:DUF4133 domain-containing protein [Sphingobacteriales bacterium]OJV98820.1 MAG: hypothetical protein BGO52_08610 [Sphingobacteriales bacterium 44-61]